MLRSGTDHLNQEISFDTTTIPSGLRGVGSSCDLLVFDNFECAKTRNVLNAILPVFIHGFGPKVVFALRGKDKPSDDHMILANNSCIRYVRIPRNTHVEIPPWKGFARCVD